MGAATTTAAANLTSIDCTDIGSLQAGTRKAHPPQPLSTAHPLPTTADGPCCPGTLTQALEIGQARLAGDPARPHLERALMPLSGRTHMPMSVHLVTTVLGVMISRPSR